MRKHFAQFIFFMLFPVMVQAMETTTTKQPSRFFKSYLDTLNYKIKQYLNDPHINSVGINLLRDASSHSECYESIKLLLKKGIDPNHIGLIQATPLYEAAKSGSLENVNLLLKYNADPNIGSYSQEQTPLMTAVEMGHAKIVKVLCGSKKINIDKKDKKCRKTALMYAVENCQKPTFHFLLLPKDKPNRLENYKLRKKIVGILLLNGANPLIKNSEGQNAIDIASENGFHELVELMQNYDS